MKSRYLVGFYGACLEPVCMVMELCSRGSLYHVLQDKTTVLTWDRFFSMAFDIAHGIHTLHTWNPQILHRDVKTLNFLVNKDWQVKVRKYTEDDELRSLILDYRGSIHQIIWQQ